MTYLKATQDQVSKMSADDSNSIKWYVDASFGVHNDMKSHTGAVLTLGSGAITSVSTKQKVMTRSSTEAELVSLDDVISKILWTSRFIEAQGFNIPSTLVYRDNTSSLRLESNGRESTSKRTRHFKIKYFFITDLVQRGEVKLLYCPTEVMLADYMTKGVVGTKFIEFRDQVLGITSPSEVSRSVLDQVNPEVSLKEVSLKVSLKRGEAGL
jgi:hypothetical protein